MSLCDACRQNQFNHNHAVRRVAVASKKYTPLVSLAQAQIALAPRDSQLFLKQSWSQKKLPLMPSLALASLQRLRSSSLLAVRALEARGLLDLTAGADGHGVEMVRGVGGDVRWGGMAKTKTRTTSFLTCHILWLGSANRNEFAGHVTGGAIYHAHRTSATCTFSLCSRAVDTVLCVGGDACIPRLLMTDSHDPRGNLVHRIGISEQDDGGP